MINMLNILKQRVWNYFLLCWKMPPKTIPYRGHSGCWSKLKSWRIRWEDGGAHGHGAGWLRRQPACHVSWSSNPLASCMVFFDCAGRSTDSTDFTGLPIQQVHHTVHHGLFFCLVLGYNNGFLDSSLGPVSSNTCSVSDDHDHPSFQRMRAIWWR